MDNKEVLMDALKFHGHRCWASVAGVRVGLAALRTLGVNALAARNCSASWKSVKTTAGCALATACNMRPAAPLAKEYW